MSHNTLSALTLALTTLVAGNVLAADASTPKTRDQVLTELAQAQRTGDILATGKSGKYLNELSPSQYPAKAAAHGYTRDQVLAELTQSQRSGDDFGKIYSHH